MHNIKLIFSLGDCNGIGLEVFHNSMKFLQKKNLKASFTLCTNSKTLNEYFSKIGFKERVINGCLNYKNFSVDILECEHYSSVEFGEINKSAGKLAVESLELSINTLLQGDFNALVTLPITKESLYISGWKFPGHTEALAAKCNISSPLMILGNKKIKVALVTIHNSIKDVPQLITASSIIGAAERFYQSLSDDFGIVNPKIAVLGLNPHSGENGSFGNEEKEIIEPSIQVLQKKGFSISGPFPADGIFAFGEYLRYDGILAMYHDQGLIPLKLLVKGGGVNFTAGLPIIRTSPDHGSALSLAGKNIANPKSTLEAIDMAIRIFKNRKKSMKK